MDPVSVALIDWMTSQAATTGTHALQRLLVGDKQQKALRKVAHEAIDAVVKQVATRDHQDAVREALLLETTDEVGIQVQDILNLRDAIMRRLHPRLTVLNEQGYDLDTDRFSDILVRLITTLIQADAIKNGPLTPVAEWLRTERLTAASEEAVTQLQELNRKAEALGRLQDAIVDPWTMFDLLGLSRPNRADARLQPHYAGFTGREWLFSQIQNFIISHKRGYILIEGEAGIGKSAFAAWLAVSYGYACHFTRHGGRNAAVAIRNLGAQLIRRLELDDFAPGGVLPPVASQPFWLYQVLAAGAARQQTELPGIPLVLVIDGLDEAEPASGPPLGLPATLPNGVFIVATMRTGTPLRWLREEHITYPLDPGSDANLADMRHYLRIATNEPKVAAALEADGIAKEQFIDTLVERSAGVWIYLRYILNEIRDRKRSPANLAELPHGLWAYYNENLDLLRSDTERWDNFYLPLLTTLAVIQEPLSPTELALLANLPNKSSDVRRFVTGTWRPFCLHSVGERYELYHQSLRDYLIGQSASASDDLPEFAGTDQLELKEAARDAHHRIADRYLIAWGGLDSHLPTLASDPRTAVLDGGYGLRHLPTHLEKAGRPVEVHQLLACEELGVSPYSHTRNVWYLAHDRASSPDIYLSHIGQAAALAQQALSNARTDGRKATAIGLEIRYTLITASIISLAASIPAELIVALLAHRVWKPIQALTYIHRKQDPEERVLTYAAIVSHLPAEYSHDVLVTALEMVRTFSYHYESHRARALAALAPHLPSALVEAALETAQAISDDKARAEALTALAPHLPPPLLTVALTTAQAIGNAKARAVVLAALAPHLPEADQPDVLAAGLKAAQAADTWDQAEALTALAPHLTPKLLGRALKTAKTLRDDWSRASVLAALAPHLPRSLLRGGLNAAKAIPNGIARMKVLAAFASQLDSATLSHLIWAEIEAAETNDSLRRSMILATAIPHLPATDQPNVLTAALEAVRMIHDNRDQAKMLAELVPYLSPSFLAVALEIAQDIHDKREQVRALTAIAAHTPAVDRLGILTMALESIQFISDEHSRTLALASLATHLTPSLLATALEIAQTIDDGWERSEVFTAFAPHMPAADQPGVLAAALETAQAIDDGWERVGALVALSDNLPEVNRPGIVAAALESVDTISSEWERADALAKLAPHLAPQLLIASLETAQAIGDIRNRVTVLAALTPYLSADNRRDVLVSTLELIRTTHFTYEPDRARALAALAPHLPSALVEAALETAQAISDDKARAEALTALAPHLPPPLLTVALTTAQAIGNAKARAVVLAALAPHLPEADQPDVLAAGLKAAQAADTWDQAEALTALAPHLTPKLLGRALKTAKTLRASTWSVEALVAIAACLPAADRAPVLAAALEAAQATSERDRAEALVTVAAHLPTADRAPVLAAALEAAQQATNERDRAEALLALAPHLDARLLVAALAIAQSIRSDTRRVRTLTALLQNLGRLDETILVQFGPTISIAALLNGLTRSSALSVLNSYAKQVAFFAGDEAIIACSVAISDVTRWWP